VSEKLLQGHGEPYLPVIIVDGLTVVPCTVDGKNHCTWEGGVGSIRNVGSRALFYVCCMCCTAVHERNHTSDESPIVSSIFR